jgi:ABC-2 type transport system permease protein
MSAVAAAREAPSAEPPVFTPPSLARLTAVELRKTVDTRAGFWLALAVVGLTLVLVALRSLLGDAHDHRFQDVLSVAVQPSSILLPIIGILLVSSEWSQRTGLTTFTLIPRRSRVLAAKLAACAALSVAALLVCLLLSALGTAVAAPGVDGTWSVPAGILGQNAVYLATSMIGGAAVGAVLLASAPAIVVYFVLPIAWSAVGTIPALEGAAKWLDGSRSMGSMTEELLSATEWARVGTTLAVWMLLPVLIGLWRIERSEIS